MTFRVHELRRAQGDIRGITEWLALRSRQGAIAWLRAYDKLLLRLAKDARLFGPAAENPACELDVRQALFKTPRGRIYRALFFITGEDVYILRVRGQGQAPVSPDDLDPK